MESNNAPRNPLAGVVAVSVIALAAVGVATLTSKANDLRLPKEVAKPIAGAISHPVHKR